MMRIHLTLTAAAEDGRTVARASMPGLALAASSRTASGWATA